MSVFSHESSSPCPVRPFRFAIARYCSGPLPVSALMLSMYALYVTQSLHPVDSSRSTASGVRARLSVGKDAPRPLWTPRVCVDQLPTAGSGPNSRTSCAQRQAAAILAAHCSASSSEGTSMIVTPAMYALLSVPSVTVSRGPPPHAHLVVGIHTAGEHPYLGFLGVSDITAWAA